MDIQQMIFEFLGGLGLFLLGVRTLGDGLQGFSSGRLRNILDRFTTNPIMGVLAGTFVTILIQSSTAVTVMTVGLVSAGFMNLRQAIGVIMGANIGTTFTAFIIGIDVGEFSLPILAIGIFLIIFFKAKRIQYVGQILFGIGGLFYGLDLMSNGMQPLGEFEAFREFALSMSYNPLFGVLIGTISTVIIQSSTATVGILQGLYADGLITLDAALPVMLGDNIGTTVTAVLASLGASVAAKRSALSHVLINVIGTTIFLIMIGPFTAFLEFIQVLLDLNDKMVIAFSHGTFNVISILILLPFITFLIWLVKKIIPGEDELVRYRTLELDPVFIEQSPSIALGAAKEEVIRMGKLAVKGMEESKQYLQTGQRKHAQVALQLEDQINILDHKITNYLVALSSVSLHEHDSKLHNMLLDCVRDIERLGDHFKNIIELGEYQENNRVTLTKFAQNDINEMFTLVTETVKEVIGAFDQNDQTKAESVIKKEEFINQLERKFRKQHILRMNEGICSAHGGVVVVDIIINLERIGDHAVNIAQAVLEILKDE